MRIFTVIFTSLFFLSSFAHALSTEQIERTIQNLYEQLDKLSAKGKDNSFEYQEIARKIRELVKQRHDL